MPYLLLGPAERADITIDFTNFGGRSIVMTNDAPTPYPGGDSTDPLPEIIQFRVASTTESNRKPYEIPQLHTPNPVLPIALEKASLMSSIANVRYLTLEEKETDEGATMTLLNGKRFMEPPTEDPIVGTVEVWNLINLTPDTHTIHVHLSHYRVLARRPFDVEKYESDPTHPIVYTGPPRAPDANEDGWKDTVKTNPAEVTTIVIPFEDYPGQYVWHCHMLEHEDFDMMRPLLVRRANNYSLA